MIQPGKWCPTVFAILLVSVGANVTTPSQSCATEETAIQVAQPIWTENEIVVSSVTYIVWLGSLIPAIEVAWTAKPNLIQREGDAAPRDRNAASLYRIDVRTPLKDPWSKEKLDTMSVVLDLSRVATRDSSLYLPLDDAVQATVESILLNAARGRPPVTKYVKLSVEGGPPEYARLSNVYNVDRSAAERPR